MTDIRLHLLNTSWYNAYNMGPGTQSTLGNPGMEMVYVKTMTIAGNAPKHVSAWMRRAYFWTHAVEIYVGK